MARTRTSKMTNDKPLSVSSSMSSSSGSSPDLRIFFPDMEAVKIYPDDYTTVDTKTGKRTVDTDLTIPDLVDRHSGHFSSKRIVIMFRPGTYENLNVPVGYWTQILGLGETPNDVVFTSTTTNSATSTNSSSSSPGVYCLPANTENPNVGSLDTFWRSAENFTSDCSLPGEEDDWKFLESYSSSNNNNNDNNNNDNTNNANTNNSNRGMLWAVSQAAPLRRINVTNNLLVSLGANNSSGGFMANVNVGGNLMFGSQQQFCVRNCNIAQNATGGAWSMVFTGCAHNNDNGNVDGDGPIPWDGASPMVVWEPKTARQVEKPFIFIGKNNNNETALYLGIPKVKHDTSGVNLGVLTDDEKVQIDNDVLVRVVNPWVPFDDIQKAANAGTHIILSPGIYNWGQTLHITQNNHVVLGLGMATIQAPGDGSPCIHVAHYAQGVRISGLCLEATVISKFIYKGSTLLQWGDAGAASVAADNDNNNPKNNPGAIHDLYCFVGGRRLERTVKVECMVKIYSDHIIGDNLWLWRADHVQLMDKEVPNMPELSEYHVTTIGECQCDTGLQVYGDNVVFVGLAVEHTYKDMVSWYGRNGQVYFYQSELPYDMIGGGGGGKQSSSSSLSLSTSSCNNKRNKKNNNPYGDDDITGYRVHTSATGHIAKGVGVYSYFRDCPNIIIDSAIVSHAYDSQFVNAFTVWLNGYSGIRSVINGQGGVTKMPGITFPVPIYNSSILSTYFWYGLFFQPTSIKELCNRGWKCFIHHLWSTIMMNNNNGRSLFFSTRSSIWKTKNI